MTKTTFVDSDKCLPFPTRVCRFRQGFVVSDKRLSFPTSACRFRQLLVVSDKCLSFCRYPQSKCPFNIAFVSNHTSRKRQRPTIRSLSFVVRQGMWGSPIFLRRFFSSKVDSPRQTLAVSDKCLSFPTRVCRFRQVLVDSDKCLSFPTSACRFRQNFCRKNASYSSRKASLNDSGNVVLSLQMTLDTVAHVKI